MSLFARFPFVVLHNAPPCPKLSFGRSHAMIASSSNQFCEVIDRGTDFSTRSSAVYTIFLVNEDKSFERSYNLDLDDPLLQVSVSDTIMSHEHVATWSLDEVGYKYIPTVAPNYFSDVESYSWEDALRAIEDHDWPVKGHSIRCNPSNDSTGRFKNTLKSTPCYLEDLTALSVKLFQETPVLVSKILPCNKEEYFTLETDDNHLSKASYLEKDGNTSGICQEFVTRSIPDIQYADKVTTGTRQLQAKPFVRARYIPPAFGTPHGEDSFQGHTDTVASVLVENELVDDCSTSRHASIAPQYDERHSSDVENHDVASPTETIATSVVGTPTMSAKEPSKFEKDALCIGLLDMMNMDKEYSLNSATATNDAPGQYLWINEDTQIRTESTYVINVEEIEQHDTHLQLTIDNENIMSGTVASVATEDDEGCLVERLLTFTGRHKHALNNHSEEAIDEESSFKNNERTTYDQNTQCSGLTAKPITMSTQHDNVIPLTTVVNNTVTNNGTPVQSSRGNIIANTDAQISGESQLLLLEKLAPEAVASHKSNYVSLLAGRSQSTATLTTAVAEWHEISISEPSYHPVNQQSSEVASPLISSITASPTIDIASIMISLATYPPPNVTPVNELKRAINCIDATEHTDEGRPTKKQNLWLEPEPAGIEEASASKVIKERHDMIESCESSISRGITVGATPHCQDDARTFDSPANTAVQTEDRVVCLHGISVPEHAKIELPVDNIATSVLLRENWRKEAGRATALAHPVQFPSVDIQSTNTDMQEPITTDSMSTSLESSMPSPNSASELCEPEITFRPLKPLTNLHKSAKVKALDTEAEISKSPQEQLAGEMEADMSDELSEVDDEELRNMSLLVSKPIIQTRKEALPTQSIVEAFECSRPAPKFDAEQNNESSPSSIQTTPRLLQEHDASYGRRTMRSATAITVKSSSTHSGSRPAELESLPVPAKETTPTPPLSIASKDCRLSKENKNDSVGSPTPRQTRSAITKTKARFTPAPSSALESKPALKAATKPPIKVESTPKASAKTTAKTASKEMAPTRPEVSPITPNPKPNAKAKTLTPTEGTEKRMTRRASAVENEIKKASEKEDNIGKRLRSKD